MKYLFSVALQPCGSCVSHSHCKDCCSPIEETLASHPSIGSIALDPLQKTLSIETTMVQDDLEDLLDDKGLYILSQLPL